MAKFLEKYASWLVTGGVALLPLVLFVYVHFWGTGTPKGLYFVREGEAERAVLVEVDAPQTRFHVLDLSTGRELAKHAQGRSSLQLLGRAGDRLWVQNHDDGVELRELLTGNLVADWKGLVAKSPALTPQLVHEPWVEDETGGLHVTCADGHEWFIDAKTLEAKPAAPDASRRLRCSNRSAGYADLSSGAAEQHFSFESPTERKHPVVADRARKETTLPPEFLKPEYLLDQASCEPLLVENPQSLFVLHRETLLPDASLRLSRMTLDGQVLWTLPLEATGLSGEFWSWQKHGSDLFLGAIPSEESRLPPRLVDIDLTTGTMRWAYEL